jgi:hypothetical protein
VIYLAATFLVLNACDIMLTASLLPLGGIELNPVAVWLFANVGMGWAAVIKMTASGLVAASACWLAREFPRLAMVTMHGLTILMFGVCTWNLAMIAMALSSW